MSLWTDKYKPKKISEIVGNKILIKKAKLWLSNFQNKVAGTKTALLLAGIPGIGKTTLANLLLKEFNFDVIEFNASDVRNQKLIRENLKNILGKQSISKLMGLNNNNGIIMDEVDGASSGEKGGISELISFINPNKGKRKKNKIKPNYINPIICICNNDSEKKMSDLKKECEYIKLFPPKTNEIYKMAEKIVLLENIKISEEDLLEIVIHSQNDIRKLICNLEYLSKKDLVNICNKDKKDKKDNKDNKESNEIEIVNKSKLSDIIEQKKVDNNLFVSVYNILNNFTGFNNILSIYESDKNLINLLIHENVLGFLDNYKNDENKKLKIMEKVYSCIACSDILDNEIFINFKYDLVQINGAVKCGGVSYHINTMTPFNTKKFLPNDIIFSKLLSKFSLHYTNYKTKHYLLNKMNIFSNFNNNYLFMEYIIKKMIIENNNKDYTYVKQLAEKYELEIEDFEKMIKIIKNKTKSTKYEKCLEELSNGKAVIDKKFVTKFIK